MFDEIWERTRKVNEYLSTKDLLDTFDETYSLDNFIGNIEEVEDATEMHQNMLPLIQKARGVVKSWQDQLSAEGKDKVYLGGTHLPSLWWEGSDAWQMAYEGDSTELERYLEEIIQYGPELDIDTPRDRFVQ